MAPPIHLQTRFTSYSPGSVATDALARYPQIDAAATSPSFPLGSLSALLCPRASLASGCIGFRAWIDEESVEAVDRGGRRRITCA